MAFAVAAASADTPTNTPTADTSGWKCTQCPFLQGYEAVAEVGVLAASGANATFGRYTGIDHSGAYADASASGELRSNDGSYVNYDLERLGLPSREGYVQGGREGRYDLRVSYDGQPTRLYDTAVTPVNIGDNRRTVALLGRFFASPGWTLFGELRRQEKNGTGLESASFLTEALQLSRPLDYVTDYVTDSFETGAAWAGRRASFRLTYTGSWFEDNSNALTFDNPYAPIVPGSTEGRLGAPPSNTLQQVAATGNVQLPWFATTLTYTASLGTLRQNESFLPVSTLANSPLPGSGSLDGDVRLSHYALGLASRPLSKLSIRGNAAYDGRDDRTTHSPSRTS